MKRAPLALAVVLVAGCLGPGDASATYVLFGDFNDYDDEIAADFEVTLAPYNATALLMEKFPPGFAIAALSLAACTELRLALIEKAYMAEVRACQEEGGAGEDGDDATSAP